MVYFVLGDNFAGLLAAYILVCKAGKKPDFVKIPAPLLYIVPVFILIGTSFILDSGAKSVGEFLTCFLLGFFVIADENMQKRLKKDAVCLAIVWLSLMLIRCLMYSFVVMQDENLNDVIYRLFEWSGITVAVGLGQRFLNSDSKFTRYFAPAAFPMYFSTKQF